MGTSASSLKASRPLTVVSSVADWTQDRTETDIANDDLDSFNHPRLRRLLILQSLLSEPHSTLDYISTEPASDGLRIYESTHSIGLLQFLDSAWDKWKEMGEEGRDPSGWSPEFKGDATKTIPPLVPTVMPLPRSQGRQRPSAHVIGQVGYYCTDTVTPIFADLKSELHQDAGVLQRVLELLTPPKSRQSISATTATNEASVTADEKEETTTEKEATEETLDEATEPTPPPQVDPSVDEDDDDDDHQHHDHEYDDHPPPVIYALTTHPGHHAARDSFGGYCYVNHVATLATHLKSFHSKIAILDVDYHCGNGTASIFDHDPHVLVVSLHCHPDYDYPFHSGYADETGSDQAKGTILHLPMMPGMVWTNYQVILEQGMAKIRNFGATICLVSLGLDTHAGDPCTIRRAGFNLQTGEYVNMGRCIARHLPGIPLVIVQEGGYRMDKVGEAAANVVLGCCTDG